MVLAGMMLAGATAASAQQVTLVSSASDGTPGNMPSSAPSISADGRFVAFMSNSANLVPNDTNSLSDVFVKDRVSGTLTRVTSTSGEQLGFGGHNPRISANGRFVMFETIGLGVAGDSNSCRIDPQAPCTDVYVHDRQTSTTTRASVSSSGAQVTSSSRALDISGDGRFVLFASTARDLVPNDTNFGEDLFLRDQQNGTTTLISLDNAGNQLGRLGVGVTGRISADGRIIVYSMAPGPSDAPVVYQFERETGVVSVLSNAFPPTNLSGQTTRAYVPLFISADGRLVVVAEAAQSGARHLLHDRLTGHTVATPWWTASPLGPVIVALSGDGRTYAYGGMNGLALVDRVSGFSETAPSSQFDFVVASLSFDGRFAAFNQLSVSAPNTQQIYVFDRDSGDGDGMPSAWETAFGLNPGNLTDANADADLDGVTNLQEYLRGSHPSALASATRYFAEGASNAFFTTRFAAVNPGDEKATVVFRFLGSGGQTSSLLRTIAPRSRITVDLPANGPTPGNDFSTVIESDRIVVADRTMTWDGTGYGAHTETALTAPSTTWYLAEGATHGAFDLFYLLQNANDFDAHVTINYLRQAPLTPVSKTYTVDRNSRKTIPVDAEGADLEAVDTAASITSDLPIVVERAMYSTRVGQPPFAAGHGAAGVTAPAMRWFLAEGATGFFDLYVLVGNPNATQSNLKVTYLLPEGQPFEKFYSVGAQRRLTIYVQDEDPRLANTPVSVIVESTNDRPVVVERAMWWPKGEWHESHVSAGATTTGTKWALADGEVTVGGDTYILIANTSTTAGTATVTLLEEGTAAPLPITVELKPSSRVSVPVSQYLPATTEAPKRRFGALIESSGVEIVVERSIYATAGGITWGAGTAALGTKLQ